MLAPGRPPTPNLPGRFTSAINETDEEGEDGLKLRVLAAVKTHHAPEGLRYAYRIQTVWVDGGEGKIETSRVVSQPPDAAVAMRLSNPVALLAFDYINSLNPPVPCLGNSKNGGSARFSREKFVSNCPHAGESCCAIALTITDGVAKMAIGRLWAGRAFGTNTGNLFVKFEGEDSALKGTIHHNEPDVGIAVYDIAGSFDGNRLHFDGTSKTQIEGVTLGRLKATASLQPTGTLEGEWETSIGSAGAFVLYPHGRSDAPPSGLPTPNQLHTARHYFGPVEIDRSQIIALAEDIQKEFAKGKVVVTFTTTTEQSRFLEDFKQLKINAGRAHLVKLFVREPDTTGVDKLISVEFGQEVNSAMSQGGNESWTLGELEKLKREIRRFERVYAAKKFGVGVNQFLFISTIVFLPSLESLRDRAILMAGVIGLALGVNWLHSQYLPHAAIYLGERKDGWLARFFPSAASWFIGISASVIATLLAAFLQGWLPLPSVGSTP